MFSIPYSRYLFYPVTWYSVLIVTGAALALFLACKEEKRSGLPKDTVLDLALWLIPGGIIGARLYYVVFSFDQFRIDLLSVFRIWEGGLAIYGGIIAGLLVLFIFCRYRKLSFLLLCDMIAPGLALAQCIGRWGNWFNTEAFGLPVTGSFPRFFPLAVQIPSDGYSWHLATFFYESMWDLAVFVFLVISRRTFLKRKNGDVFFFYLFLYAAGRLVIEELRTDSLFASSVRISQLLSVLICIAILMLYRKSASDLSWKHPLTAYVLFPLAVVGALIILLYTFSFRLPFMYSFTASLSVLCLCSFAMIIGLFSVYFSQTGKEI